MKWTKFFKNTVSIAAAAAALFTAIALPSPNRAAAAGEDQVSDLPTKLMNGDFEWPNIDTALGRADIQAYNGNTSGTYHGTDGDYSISNNDTEYTDIIFRRHSIGWGQYDDPCGRRLPVCPRIQVVERQTAQTREREQGVQFRAGKKIERQRRYGRACFDTATEDRAPDPA